MEKNHELNSSELERLSRKYSNNIVISGISVIFFGLWSLFKYIIVLTSDDFPLDDYFQGFDDYDTLDVVFFYIILITLLAIVTFIHYYIGRSAILAGRGKKKKRLYLFLAFLLLLLTISNFPLYFSPESSSSADVTAASILVDIAFCFSIIDMLYSAFRLRFIKKSLGRM